MLSWRLVLRALFLRGGIVWLVGTHYRVLPRRLPGTWPWSRSAMKFNARRQGRKDGRLGLPTAEQMDRKNPDFPGHLLYLKNKGDRLVRAVLTAMVRVDTRRGGRSAAISHVRQLLNHRNDERAALEDAAKRLRKSGEEVKRREDVLNECKTTLGEAKTARSAADVWSRGLSGGVYKFLLLAFTVAELPLLALAFQNFFSVFFSIVVSVGVSIAIIFCAHAAGVLLHKRETVLLLTDARILGAIWIGVIGTIAGLSIVRELYFETTTEATGVASGPAWLLVIVFGVFNVLVFGAAVLLSKFRHSAYAERVDDAKRAVRAAARDIRRERRHERRLRRSVARHQDRIVLLDGLANSTAQRARTSVDQAKLAALRQKDFIEKCYALYVRENKRAQAARAERRSALRQPLESGPLPSFTRLPEVKDPEVEFKPFEERVNRDLMPLEKLLSLLETPPQLADELRGANGKGEPAEQAVSAVLPAPNAP